MKLMYVIFIGLIFSSSVWSMDFGYLKCKTTGEEKGHRFDIRMRDGHLSTSLSTFKGKSEEKIQLSERSMMHAVALKEPCELHVFSRHPQDFILQFQAEYRNFDRKKIRHDVELRGQWDYRHKNKNAGEAFYKLVECEFHDLVLPKEYVSACAKLPAKKVEVEKYKGKKWENYDSDYGGGGSSPPSGGGGGSDR